MLLQSDKKMVSLESGGINRGKKKKLKLEQRNHILKFKWEIGDEQKFKLPKINIENELETYLTS